MIQPQTRPKCATPPRDRSGEARGKFFAQMLFAGAMAAAIACVVLPAAAQAQGPVMVGTNIPGMPRGTSVSPKAAAIASKSAEEPALALAMANFQAISKNAGPSAWQAVSAQTKVPVTTLKQQQGTTKLNYGELIVANSIASASRNPFARVVALYAESRSWSELARKLRVDPNLLAKRVVAAGDSLGNPGAQPASKSGDGGNRSAKKTQSRTGER